MPITDDLVDEDLDVHSEGFRKKSNRVLMFIEESKEKSMERIKDRLDAEEASQKSIIESDQRLGADFDEPFDEKSNIAVKDLNTKSDKGSLHGYADDGEDEDLNQVSTKPYKNSITPMDDELREVKDFQDPMELKAMVMRYSKEIRSDDEGRKDDSKHRDKAKKDESHNKSDNEY